MSEVTLQNLDKSLPLVINYERLINTVHESIARSLGYIAGKDTVENIEEVVARHEAEIGEQFDAAICDLLGALSISRCHIIIEADISEGFGPDHTFPWEAAAHQTLGQMGGNRKLEVIRKSSPIATDNSARTVNINEAALAA